MKKTTVKAKLVLRKDTTRVLVDKDLTQVAAGAEKKESEVVVTCVRRANPEQG